MSRRAAVSPPWLDRLLVGWGLRSLREQGSGWYRVNPMLRDGIPSGHLPTEPFELGGEDYRAVADAVGALAAAQRSAVVRAYKPWAAASIDALEPLSRQTWCDRLKAAASVLEGKLRRGVAFEPKPD